MSRYEKYLNITQIIRYFLKMSEQFKIYIYSTNSEIVKNIIEENKEN